MKKKSIMIVFLIISLSIIVAGLIFVVFFIYQMGEYGPPTCFAEMCIENNSELKKIATSGIGSVSNPYIIDSFELSTTDLTALYIRFFETYAIIQNSNFTASLSGIRISNMEGMITIKDCSFFGCGMEIRDSEKINIESNDFHENNRGITIRDGVQFLTMRNNFFDFRGFEISDTDDINFPSLELENNWVGNKKLLFLENSHDRTIYGNFSQLILYKCSNITALNSELNSVSNGLILLDCYNCEISDLVMKDIYYGILISESSFLKFDNITIINKISDAKFGFFILDSSNVLLKDCILKTFKYQGFFARRTEPLHIINCTVENCEEYGMSIGTSSYSIVQNCTFLNNFVGMLVLQSSHSLFYFNHFEANQGYSLDYSGIGDEGATNSSIFLNNFIDNNIGGSSQACDDNIGNCWYNTVSNMGNFWSDYESGYYFIDGTANLKDYYPLSEAIEF